MAHKVYRDKETGEFVDRETYNRSRAQGGSRYEAVDAPDVQDNPTQVFGTADDLFNFDPGDYDGEYEDLFYDGGADYGEE